MRAGSEDFEQNGDFVRTSLPTIEVDAIVDPEQALQALGEIPQAWLVSSLFSVHHRSDVAGDWLARMVSELNFRHREDWDDSTLQRILVDQTPEDPEEEEFMRLVNLKGALAWLSWTALTLSTIPDDIKSGFSLNAGKGLIAEYTYDSEVAILDAWAKGHPEENKPLKDISLLMDPVRRVCVRLKQLAEFYNAELPIAAVYRVEFSDDEDLTGLGYFDTLIRLSKYDAHMKRFSIIASLLKLLGSNDKVNKLASDIGIQNEA